MYNLCENKLTSFFSFSFFCTNNKLDTHNFSRSTVSSASISCQMNGTLLSNRMTGRVQLYVTISAPSSHWYNFQESVVMISEPAISRYFLGSPIKKIFIVTIITIACVFILGLSLKSLFKDCLFYCSLFVP